MSLLLRFQSANIKQWIRERTSYLLGGCSILLIILVITEVLVLFDFLPRLVGVPGDFPVKGECFLAAIEYQPNLCPKVYDQPEGGVFTTWQSCFIGRLVANYTTEDLDFQNNIHGGSCIYRFEDSAPNTRELGFLVSRKFIVGETYDCWLSVTQAEQDLCVLLNLKSAETGFMASQIAIGLLLICAITGTVFIYCQKLANRQWWFNSV